PRVSVSSRDPSMPLVVSAVTLLGDVVCTTPFASTSLEEQHEPGGHVRLPGPVRPRGVDWTGRVTGRALLGALQDKLQRLRPLVVDTDGVRVVVRHHVLVTIAIRGVLEAAESPANADVRLRADLVHQLSVAAV